MMLDFDTVMVSDCLAALSDDEHRASLETFIQQFGDVMNSQEVLAVLRRAIEPGRGGITPADNKSEQGGRRCAEFSWD